MGGRVRYVFRRHLFVLIGVLSFALFFIVAGLDDAGKIQAAHALARYVRVLIVPMYLIWMLLAMAQVAIVGPVGLPAPLGIVVSGISLVAGLAPYVLADYVLDRWRHAAVRKVADSEEKRDR